MHGIFVADLHCLHDQMDALPLNRDASKMWFRSLRCVYTNAVYRDKRVTTSQYITKQQAASQRESAVNCNNVETVMLRTAFQFVQPTKYKGNEV